MDELDILVQDIVMWIAVVGLVRLVLVLWFEEVVEVGVSWE